MRRWFVCTGVLVVIAACVLVPVLAGTAGASTAEPPDSALTAATETFAPSYSREELELVRLINEHRVANGREPLLISDMCSEAAKRHSSDMGRFDFFSHTTVKSSWFEPGANALARMVASGYPAVSWGENIAAGWNTARQVFDAWKQSVAHNGFMLGTTWKVIGIGSVYEDYSEWGWYWTADFGSYRDATAHPPGEVAPPDTTSPTVAFVSPKQGAIVSGSVPVNVTATDDIGVTRVDLYAGGVLVTSTSTSPFVLVWDASALDSGPVLLEVRACDAAGNVGSAQQLVNVVSSPDNGTTTTVTTEPTSTTTTTSTSTTTTSTTSTTVPQTTSTTASTTTTSSTRPPQVFADVRPSHRFYTAISGLAELGVVSGSDGLFRPDVPVTRAQFAKIIVLALDRHTQVVENASRPTFKDVPYTGAAYPFDFIEEAAALKIIQGRVDGTFGPAENVTRAQVALMLARAGGERLAMPSAGDKIPFTDVPAYAREAVNIAFHNGLISGKTATTFAPYDQATRGQVAKMVWELYGVIHRP